MAKELRPVIDPDLHQRLRLAAVQAGFSTPSPFINDLLRRTLPEISPAESDDPGQALDNRDPRDFGLQE